MNISIVIMKKQNQKIFIWIMKIKNIKYAIQIVKLANMEEMGMKIIVHHVKIT